jgi:hypothetical protein
MKYSRIDWKKDIVEYTNNEKFDDLTKVSFAIKNWVKIDSHIREKYFNKENVDKEILANGLKILQYFLGRFVYTHSLFYKKEVDFNHYPITDLEQNLPESSVPIEQIRKIEDSFNKENLKEKKEKEREYTKKSLKVLNILKKYINNVRLVDDFGDRFTRFTFEYEIDNITYRLFQNNYHSLYTDIKEKLNRNKIANKKYNDLILSIHSELVRLKPNEMIWVMEGGGMKEQIFFGNEKGYIGILYLDLRSEKRSNREYTFTLQSKNKELRNGLVLPGIKVRYFGES